jgi:hypothetical protein
MSTSAADVRAGAVTGTRPKSATERARSYFASDGARTLQTVLGLLWLLDAGLQFQSFMYSHGFIAMLESQAAGQPGWIHDSIKWGVHIASHQLAVYNTLFALSQLAIGIGLLYRPAVKAALLASFAWAFFVWWFGEAFGMMFMNSVMAMPLTGAPGAVILYPLVGLIAWPNGRPGGLLGVRGARIAWAALWLVMAWLWLQAPNSSDNAISNAINAAPSGMSWLSSVQIWAADRLHGHGLPIALLLAAASAVIGIAVAINWRPIPFLALAAGLGLVYWVFGEGFGGIFQGGATDPNSGPLWVLLAYALYTLVRYDGRSPQPTQLMTEPGGS